MEHASSNSTTPKEALKKQPASKKGPPTDISPQREPGVPLMLRPKPAQKMCAEQVADQIGIKRSQLDPHFYLAGALLTGVERLGRAEKIGTWTRKEAAVFLKNAFLPLFELLYEQEELPLIFDLLLARGVQPATLQSQSVAEPVPSPSFRASMPTSTVQQEASSLSQREEAYVPLLSMDAEVGLDGFPGGI